MYNKSEEVIEKSDLELTMLDLQWHCNMSQVEAGNAIEGIIKEDEYFLN